MENQNFELTYKHYIPIEWIEEFESNLTLSQIDIDKIRNDEQLFFATGPEISDIIIFIKNNPESILFYPALYDTVKWSVLNLFKKLKTLNLKNIKSYKTANSLRKQITIQYKNSKDENVRIDINGELDIDEIEQIIDNSFQHIRKKKSK